MCPDGLRRTPINFGHKNILKFEAEARPFADTDEMDEVLIANWNRVVAPGDVVIHLGDAIMGDFQRGIEKMTRLNGTILLVPGNHDRVFSDDRRRERFKDDYLRAFHEILPEQVEIELDSGDAVRLCHFPFEGDHTTSDRYPDKRPVDDGLPLIHGHVHGLWKFRGRQFNVGVDVNGLRPVSEDEIISWVQSL